MPAGWTSRFSDDYFLIRSLPLFYSVTKLAVRDQALHSAKGHFGQKERMFQHDQSLLEPKLEQSHCRFLPVRAANADHGTPAIDTRASERGTLDPRKEVDRPQSVAFEYDRAGTVLALAIV